MSSLLLTIHYFYSPTCSSCSELVSYFQDTNFDNIKIVKYNIAEKDNKGILNAYCKEYKVKKSEFGLVPIIFIGNTYLSGSDNIKRQLESLIEKERFNKTKKIIYTDYTYDIMKFNNMNFLTVFFAGLLNGFNPCSLSIFIFFISLIINGKRPLIIGLSFILGKFLSFLILGIYFFNLLQNVQLFIINGLVKYMIFTFFAIMCIANLYDYFVSKRMKFEKIKLKLPNKLIKNIHHFIRQISNYNSFFIITLFCFILGLIINFGEFLCTGQIYLATIVTMIKNNIYKYHSIKFLIVYDLAYISPLLIITLLVTKVKTVYNTSERLIKYIPLIKLLNAIFFLVLILIYIF